MVRVHGPALPSGEVVDLCADGERWRLGPVAGVDQVVEGWLLPGLADVHTHPGAAGPGQPLDEQLLREDLSLHASAGVTLVRCPGLAGEPPEWFGSLPDLPRAVHAGPWLTRPGQFFDGWGLRPPEAELAKVAAAQAARSGWCKLIGDWLPDDEPLPLEVLEEVVAAVHAVGGRVAVHAQQTEGAGNAVKAGVDSGEHGMGLDPALLDQMARQGTVLVPTLRCPPVSGPNTRSARIKCAYRDLFPHRPAISGSNRRSVRVRCWGSYPYLFPRRLALVSLKR
jgi:hypothetical protein